MLYKNLTITKISDHGGTEKTPTHALVVTDEKYQNKKTVGKLWTKTKEYGKFLTGSMSDDYTKADGTFFTGFRIISLEEYEKLAGKQPINDGRLTGQEAEDNKAQIGLAKRIREQAMIDAGEVNPNDIPF